MTITITTEYGRIDVEARSGFLNDGTQLSMKETFDPNHPRAGEFTSGAVRLAAAALEELSLRIDPNLVRVG